MKTILYPGSFDPVTNGHLDVAFRAAAVFDRVVIAVSVNSEKNPLFTIEERMEMLRFACRPHKNIEVANFSGLLAKSLAQFQASAVIRGLRAVSDFEYEFQMALMNRELNADCETLFMMTSPEYSFVSSRLIKEIALCGGDISPFVPDFVADAIRKKAEQGAIRMPGGKPRD